MSMAGRMVRDARRRAGLTQRQLAAKAGIPQETIARIERGRADPARDARPAPRGVRLRPRIDAAPRHRCRSDADPSPAPFELRGAGGPGRQTTRFFRSRGWIRGGAQRREPAAAGERKPPKTAGAPDSFCAERGALRQKYAARRRSGEAETCSSRGGEKIGRARGPLNSRGPLRGDLAVGIRRPSINDLSPRRRRLHIVDAIRRPRPAGSPGSRPRLRDPSWPFDRRRDLRHGGPSGVPLPT